LPYYQRQSDPDSDNTECGPGAGCNPISSPPDMCFFTLPKPTKFPIGSNPWAIPQNNEIDLCLPPACEFAARGLSRGA
jgi:hypothetical protein